MISPMVGHLNPTLFEDPLKFNPGRWTVSSSKTQHSFACKLEDLTLYDWSK